MAGMATAAIATLACEPAAEPASDVAVVAPSPAIAAASPAAPRPSTAPPAVAPAPAVVDAGYIEDFVPRAQDPPRLRLGGSEDDVEIDADRLPAVTTDGKQFVALVTGQYTWMDHGSGHMDEDETKYERILVFVDAATGRVTEAIVVLRDPYAGSASGRARARKEAKRTITKLNARLAKQSWRELVEGELVLAKPGDVLRGNAGSITLTRSSAGHMSAEWTSGVDGPQDATVHADFATCRAFALAEFDSGSATWSAIDTLALPSDARVDDISARSCPRDPAPK